MTKELKGSIGYSQETRLVVVVIKRMPYAKPLFGPAFPPPIAVRSGNINILALRFSRRVRIQPELTSSSLHLENTAKWHKQP
jgi:hypothetical protein